MQAASFQPFFYHKSVHIMNVAYPYNCFLGIRKSGRRFYMVGYQYLPVSYKQGIRTPIIRA